MRIVLSKLICILLLSTTVCAQEIYVIVGGDKPPAISYSGKRTPTGQMYIDMSIPDTLDHVTLITGDHKFFGDTVKVCRHLKKYMTNGEVVEHYIQTNNKLHYWTFNPHHHRRIYLSEYIIEQ